MINWTALIVFLLLFGLVTWMGFIAAHWRKGDLDLLHEWGLGGRRFGTVVTWFLIGGDLYTAYTFIAVPALLFGAGAIGFFAIPYTIMVYPILFIVFPRLWSVAHKHGYITSADFVRGRFGNRWLALAIALTGILATMPYIALQLVGIQVVTRRDGHRDHRPQWRSSADHRLRHPGGLHLHVRPTRTGDDRHRQGRADLRHRDRRGHRGTAPSRRLRQGVRADPRGQAAACPTAAGSLGSFSAYATLALGSALALFLYPHSITGVLSSSSARVIRRNAAALPAYSVMLGLLALVGFMAIAVGVQSMPEFADGFKRYGNNFSVPALFLAMFPSWFVGVAFAAIAIGALVPAAIMSIATANTFTRNIYREFVNPACTNAEEARMAKIVSLVIKAGALAFIIFVPLQFAIYLQLLGGVWIIQTLPSVILGLYTRMLNGWALLIGWATGFCLGTWMAASMNFAPVYPLRILGTTVPCYIALASLVVNLVVAVVLSLLFNAAWSDRHKDTTVAGDYA